MVSTYIYRTMAECTRHLHMQEIDRLEEENEIEKRQERMREERSTESR
jgi:hypothetical protein